MSVRKLESVDTRGVKSTEELLALFTKEEQEEIIGDAVNAIAKIRLENIRKNKKITQKEMAKKLHVTQANVSLTENSEDIKLSSLRRYIHALDGVVCIQAKFPDGTTELVYNEELDAIAK